MENYKPKTLSDFKEEIHKCSKCGICQSACPIYKATGNECSVSRGLFIMLNGVLKGDLKLNKNINKYLDLCLKCNKCKDVCPSEINPLDIILCAKNEYYKKSFIGKIYSILESKLVYNTGINLIGKVLRLFNKKVKSESFDKKAIYFGGCISKLDPKTNDFAIKLLNRMKIEVLDIDFNCCGIPFLTTGNIERFQEQAIENILKLPDNSDYFITDCASCAWAWKEYIKYVEDEKLKEKLENINFKSIYELLLESDIKISAKNKHSITYHKPCHEKDDGNILSILKSIKNVEFKEMEGYDECCGFPSYECPNTLSATKRIRLNKKNYMNKTGADIITTSCVGCSLALKMLSPKTTIKRIITFLNDFCEIK